MTDWNSLTSSCFKKYKKGSDIIRTYSAYSIATIILPCKMRSDISHDAIILCNLAAVLIFPTGPWFCATLCWHQYLV